MDTFFNIPKIYPQIDGFKDELKQARQEHFERVREAHAKSVENAVRNLYKKESKDGRIGSPEPGNRDKEL